MDDLISKHKLIEDINECCGMREELRETDCFCGIKKIIEKQSTVDNWISVNDRLPKKDGKYLTYTIFSTDKICSDLFFKDGVWYVDNGCYDLVIGEVTHWMPLVEPT